MSGSLSSSSTLKAVAAWLNYREEDELDWTRRWVVIQEYTFDLFNNKGDLMPLVSFPLRELRVGTLDECRFNIVHGELSLEFCCCDQIEYKEFLEALLHVTTLRPHECICTEVIRTITEKSDKWKDLYKLEQTRANEAEKLKAQASREQLRLETALGDAGLARDQMMLERDDALYALEVEKKKAVDLEDRERKLQFHAETLKNALNEMNKSTDSTGVQASEEPMLTLDQSVQVHIPVHSNEEGEKYLRLCEEAAILSSAHQQWSRRLNATDTTNRMDDVQKEFDKICQQLEALERTQREIFKNGNENNDGLSSATPGEFNIVQQAQTKTSMAVAELRKKMESSRRDIAEVTEKRADSVQQGEKHVQAEREKCIKEAIQLAQHVQQLKSEEKLLNELMRNANQTSAANVNALQNAVDISAVQLREMEEAARRVSNSSLQPRFVKAMGEEVEQLLQEHEKKQREWKVKALLQEENASKRSCEYHSWIKEELLPWHSRVQRSLGAVSTATALLHQSLSGDKNHAGAQGCCSMGIPSRSAIQQLLEGGEACKVMDQNERTAAKERIHTMLQEVQAHASGSNEVAAITSIAHEILSGLDDLQQQESNISPNLQLLQNKREEEAQDEKERKEKFLQLHRVHCKLEHAAAVVRGVVQFVGNAEEMQRKTFSPSRTASSLFNEAGAATEHSLEESIRNLLRENMGIDQPFSALSVDTLETLLRQFSMQSEREAVKQLLHDTQSRESKDENLMDLDKKLCDVQERSNMAMQRLEQFRSRQQEGADKWEDTQSQQMLNCMKRYANAEDRLDRTMSEGFVPLASETGWLNCIEQLLALEEKHMGEASDLLSGTDLQLSLKDAILRLAEQRLSSKDLLQWKHVACRLPPEPREGSSSRSRSRERPPGSSPGPLPVSMSKAEQQLYSRFDGLFSNVFDTVQRLVEKKQCECNWADDSKDLIHYLQEKLKQLDLHDVEMAQELSVSQELQPSTSPSTNLVPATSPQLRPSTKASSKTSLIKKSTGAFWTQIHPYYKKSVLQETRNHQGVNFQALLDASTPHGNPANKNKRCYSSVPVSTIGAETWPSTDVTALPFYKNKEEGSFSPPAKASL